jgi:hypothetical protein
MAHKYGNIIIRNVRFYFGANTNARFYFPYHPEYSKTLIWGYYTDLEIPAIGSTVTDDGTTAGQLLVHEGPEYAGQFVAPVDCRLVGMAYSVWLYNPEDGAEKFRLGAMHCQFTDEQTRTDDATWKTLGYIDSSTLSGDEAGQVQKGSTTFSSTNGDIAAGELIGIVGQQFGSSDSANVGGMNGVVTLMLEVQ